MTLGVLIEELEKMNPNRIVIPGFGDYIPNRDRRHKMAFMSKPVAQVQEMLTCAKEAIGNSYCWEATLNDGTIVSARCTIGYHSEPFIGCENGNKDQKITDHTVANWKAQAGLKSENSDSRDEEEMGDYYVSVKGENFLAAFNQVRGILSQIEDRPPTPMYEPTSINFTLTVNHIKTQP